MLGRWINPHIEVWTTKLRRRRKLRDMQHLRTASGQALTIRKNKEARCQNCNASLSGPFCHLCGQKDKEMRRPIWEFTEEILDNVFSMDSKTLKTLFLLVAIPGGLSRTYMDGRRARFVPPIRLFVLTFFLFFILMEAFNIPIIDVSITPEEEYIKSEEKRKTNPDPIVLDEDGKIVSKKGAITIRQKPADVIDRMTEAEKEELKKAADAAGLEMEEILKDKSYYTPTDNTGGLMSRLKLKMLTPIADEDDRIALTREQIDRLVMTGTKKEWADRFKDELTRALADPMVFNRIINERLQWALIIFMPLFGILLRIFHWRKDQRLMDQFVFSLHYHAYLMLLMVILIPIVPIFGGEVAVDVFSLGSVGYLFVALKVGQKQGWFRTFFKFILIMPVYFIALTSFVMVWVWMELAGVSFFELISSATATS
ncbi:DUF3667 domain-containing protein [Temperatibacter marinus]|uniref:DUF3667 domain-containing protein n=1 Tax=Temperatibacter marinus TaxID=1456591 RepID=A0AA52EFA0_9PROT|nr:DUF3667 domain-containing protein [Temperatibacter marinus]WND02028.1 DUF3667 domain-containing protein [Temperatibacter marinus]